MHLKTFPARLGRFACLAALLVTLAARAQTNLIPVITQQPVGGIASVGEEFIFTVVATNAAPLFYQWRQFANPLTGQTNASLRLTNLATGNAGNYTVTVSNTVAAVTSTNALLNVLTNNARRIFNGRVVESGGQAAVPLVLRATGRENSVSFSLSYNSNAWNNPVFIPADTNTSVTSNTSVPGVLGLTLSRPAGSTFAAGYRTLGLARFDLNVGANTMTGALGFTTNPVSISGTDTNAVALLVNAAVEPEFTLLSTNAVLNKQSGLFEWQLSVANPGAAVLSNVDILTLTLGVDSRTNAIVFQNGHNARTAAPFGDPLIFAPQNHGCGFAPGGGVCNLESFLSAGAGTGYFDSTATNTTLPYAQVRDLAPGESRIVTLEFFVQDHFTVPTPVLSLFQGSRLTNSAPSNTVAAAVTASRFVSNRFLVEFLTQTNRLYFIQYATNVTDLTTSNALTVLPPVFGTGSRVQWLDNGPPKTESPPTNGSRFYRVLETQ